MVVWERCRMVEALHTTFTISFLTCLHAFWHDISTSLILHWWRFLFSDILQPQWEWDHCTWIGWSFASEPEPSEAKVSQAIKFLFVRGVHWDCSVFHRPVLIPANTAQYILHYDTSMDGCMESHSWAPTQLSVACHTILKIPKSCLGMRVDCVHLLHTRWRGLLNHLSA